jgi:cyclohexyl-isocyanide hydratase
MNRRDAVTAALGVGGLALLSTTAGAQQASHLLADEPTVPVDLSDAEKPVLAMLAYPGMFPLDLVGPEAVFSSMGTHKIELVWKDLSIVRSSSGLGIVPSMTFANTPAEIDILFVPGGAAGTIRMMEDPAIIEFLQSRAPKARYITSVCTGSMILAAAGLLNGYRATSHWVLRDRLAQLGAIPVRERVVEDRNRVTGAGVSAGIDMALTLAERLIGVHAKAIALNIEYDPNPPFRAGTPEQAGDEVTAMMTDAYKPFVVAADQAIPRIRARLGL